MFHTSNHAFRSLSFPALGETILAREGGGGGGIRGFIDKWERAFLSCIHGALEEGHCLTGADGSKPQI